MICDKITHIKNYPELNKFSSHIKEAVENISELKNGSNELDGKNLVANKFSLICGTGKTLYESHKMYADVHFIIKGSEKINYLKNDINDKAYDESTDSRISYDSYCDFKSINLSEGDFCVFFPGEPHSPGNISDKDKINVDKIVFKLKMA